MSHQPSGRLSRRSFLRGTGLAIALPYLEAMMPHGARAAEPSPETVPRMGIFYFGTGMNMREFTPEDTGPGFTTTRILEPLEPHRGDFTVLSGVWLKDGGGHGGCYPFATGRTIEEISAGRGDASPDHVVARQLAGRTRFPSIRMSVGRGTSFGSNAIKTISWNEQGVPLAAENDPSVLFASLFETPDPAEKRRRRRRFRRRGSVLDAVRENARRLQGELGQGDRRQLEQYFTSVREVEAQLQRDITWSEKRKPRPATSGMGDFSYSHTPERRGEDFSYERYAKLMYDLIALAFQTDSTRVLTYVVRRELAGGVYPEFDVSKGYHSLSHHGNDPQNLEELARVDTIYSRHWAYFLDRLKSIPEGDGTLLDSVLLGYSSGMGIGHSKDRLPTLLAGGKKLGVQHQGHLRLPDKTPLANVWLTMMDRMDLPDPPERIHDSTGRIEALVG